MSYEKRREPRYNVAVAATYSNGGQQQAVRVTNVSARGCRFVSADRRLGPGAFLTMLFGRVGVLDAKVRWRVGKTHGVRFDQELHPAALDHIRLFLSEQPALTAETVPA